LIPKAKCDYSFGRGIHPPRSRTIWNFFSLWT